MKKFLFISIACVLFLLVAYLFSRRNADISLNEYTLTLITYPGDRIDLYKYVNYSVSHQEKEVFYMKEVGESGKLNVKLHGGKYAVWARCLEISCQRSFDGPRVITLDKNKIIKLEWISEY